MNTFRCWCGPYSSIPRHVMPMSCRVHHKFVRFVSWSPAGAQPASCCQSHTGTPLKWLRGKQAFLISEYLFFFLFIIKKTINNTFSKDVHCYKNYFCLQKRMTKCDFSWALVLLGFILSVRLVGRFTHLKKLILNLSHLLCLCSKYPRGF